MTNDRTIRYASVGASRATTMMGIGTSQGHGTAAAVCDINLPKARQRCEELNAQECNRDVRAFDSLDALLAWGEFDAAYIGTPDRTHHDVAMRLMHAGKHVYVEKPMATTVADAADLVRTQRETGLIGAVGHEFRRTRGLVLARELIAEGRIGTPRLAVTLDYCGRMGSYWRRGLWRDDAITAHDSLTLQKAIHQLDIQGFLLGQTPRQVYASQGQDHYGGDKPAGLTCDDCPDAQTCRYHISRMQWNGHQAKVFHERLCVFGSDVHLHDNQTVQIDYAGGARGSYVECFFTPEYRVEHQVIGDRGQMNIRYFVGVPHIELELLEIGSTRREVLLPVGEESSHGGGDTAMVREFCEAVRQGRPADPDLLAGYRAVALAKAIDASGESRRPETVAEDP